MVLLAVDVLLAMGIITLVLLQHGKGADAGAAFGSGASATVFGAKGSTSFLSTATGVLAALFFLNSLSLAYLASHRSTEQSIVETLSAPAPSSSSPSGVAEQGQPVDVPAGESVVPAGVEKPATDVPGAGAIFDDVPMTESRGSSTSRDGSPADVPNQ
ncbi:MAG: preprotein translocase subunit SecG [Gammaproteobacteria bacterium]|nr:preprotein translocase subunit SecG [Gammaproteobacteria bacterium]